MKTLTKTLLAASALVFLLTGQTAFAGEESPRDEYSIGLVWDDGFRTDGGYEEKSRINYSLQDISTVFSDDDSDFFISENH